MTQELTAKQELFIRLYRNRHLAHKILFAHRHAEASPPFHRDMITDWHSQDQFNCELAFRGSAKSTIGEEGACIGGLFKDFEYCMFFGASGPLADERLHAIKHEYDSNERIFDIFGDVRGSPWMEGDFQLKNGVTFKSKGRGAAMRGTKGEVERPDFVVFDDIEDWDTVQTEKGRERIQRWALTEVIPAMSNPATRRVRMLANALHPDSLAMKLHALAKYKPEQVSTDEDTIFYGWKVRRVPIVYLDENGHEQSAWPERYPMKWIKAERTKLYALGRGADWEAEYMVAPASARTRSFKQEMIKVEPRVRTYQATYAMTDPARTSKGRNADTGQVVWSWSGPRLLVWSAWGKQLPPDEIVNSLFEVQDAFQPVWNAVEADGLEDFLLQPIRQRQVRDAMMMPLLPVRAPRERSKEDFIKQLQPFYLAGEVIHCKPLPELENQLLGFPTMPKRDVVNALAFALRLRPGAPLYEDFGGKHVTEGLTPAPRRPVWLCLNATRGYVTAILCQTLDGAFRVYADVVREGDPGAVVADIVSWASLEAGQRVRPVCGPQHFQQFANVGLVQGLKKVPIEVRPSVAPERGRAYMRKLLQRERQAIPAMWVDAAASWTANGLLAGYSRKLMPGGQLADLAEDNVYKTLIEGLESFMGLLDIGSTDDENDATNAVTHDGTPYRSMLRGRG